MLREELDGVGLLSGERWAPAAPPPSPDAEPGATHALDLHARLRRALGVVLLLEEPQQLPQGGQSEGGHRRGDDRGGAERVPPSLRVAAAGWGYDEPPYPAELFSALVESARRSSGWRGSTARPIAGALLLEGSEDILYWSGAMDREHQGVAPSNAIIRDAIAAACERGCRTSTSGRVASSPASSASRRASVRSSASSTPSRFSSRLIARPGGSCPDEPAGRAIEVNLDRACQVCGSCAARIALRHRWLADRQMQGMWIGLTSAATAPSGELSKLRPGSYDRGRPRGGGRPRGHAAPAEEAKRWHFGTLLDALEPDGRRRPSGGGQRLRFFLAEASRRGWRVSGIEPSTTPASRPASASGSTSPPLRRRSSSMSRPHRTRSSCGT